MINRLQRLMAAPPSSAGLRTIAAVTAVAAAMTCTSVLAQSRRTTAPAAPGAVPAATPAPAVAQPVEQSSDAAYHLASGDFLRITVFQNPDLSVETRLSESGTISFPLIGNVAIGGLTVRQAEQRIADRLRTGGFVNRPQVSILVTEVKGNQVSVLGQVSRPGRYPLDSGGAKLSDILAMAGGVAGTGADLLVLSGERDRKPFRVEIDLPQIFAQARTDADLRLRNGDVIWVDRAPMVYIYGEVQRPGVIRLERNMTLMQALASAGGLSQRGTERGLRVSRRDAEGVVHEMQPGMNDLLRPDDVIYVRESVF